MVHCPICDKPVKETNINRHLDSECESFIDEPSPPPTTQAKPKAASFFSTPAAKRSASFKDSHLGSLPLINGASSTQQLRADTGWAPQLQVAQRRQAVDSCYVSRIRDRKG